MDAIIREYELPAHTVGFGVKGAVTWSPTPIRNYRDYKLSTDFEVAELGWLWGINRGILTPPAWMISGWCRWPTPMPTWASGWMPSVNWPGSYAPKPQGCLTSGMEVPLTAFLGEHIVDVDLATAD